MLRVVDVSKSYNGKDVLNNISFSLDEGEKADNIDFEKFRNDEND